VTAKSRSGGTRWQVRGPWALGHWIPVNAVGSGPRFAAQLASSLPRQFDHNKRRPVLGAERLAPCRPPRRLGVRKTEGAFDTAILRSRTAEANGLILVPGRNSQPERPQTVACLTQRFHAWWAGVHRD
jgi:hypothetical protein